MTAMNQYVHLRPMRFATLGLAALLLLACGRGESTPAGEAAAHEDAPEESRDSGLVHLTEAAFRAAGIDVTTVGPGTAFASGMSVPGRAAFDPARVAVISPRSAGRLERLTVVEGDEVAAGAEVAYILSREFLTAQSDFVQAVRRAATLAGTPDGDAGSALAVAARRRLILLGASEGMTDSLTAGGAPRDFLPIRAPFSGSIVEAHTRVGEAVEAGTALYTLADLSALDVVAAVPEHLLGGVARGQAARIRLTAYPDRGLVGRVARIGAMVHADTRTVDVIVQVPNGEGLLRDGMFATVTLLRDGAHGGATPSIIALPDSAVLWDGEGHYLFVQVGERSYERRLVSVAPPNEATPGLLHILDGLAVGEIVVTDGAFTLKAELSKASFGDEH